MAKDKQVTVEYFKNLNSDAVTAHQMWKTLWEDCARYALPRKSGIFHSEHNLMQPRASKTEYQYDSTAQDACDHFASSLHGLVNPTGGNGGQWFKIESNIPELMDDTEIVQWFDDVTDAMHDELGDQGSSFVQEFDEFNIDIGTFGTAMQIIEEGQTPKDRIRFRTYSVDSFRIIEDADGNVSAVFLDLEYTVMQLMDKYTNDDDTIPESIRKLAEKSPNDKIKVLRCIMKKPKYTNSFASITDEPVLSVDILPDHDAFIRKSGYPEFPAPVARWRKSSNERYGTSPTMKAMPDIKMVNAMSRSLIEATEKALNPPLQIPSNSFLGRIKTFPKALNFYNPVVQGQQAMPLTDVGNIPLTDALIQQRRDAIDRSYFRPMLSLPEDPNMTAYQISQLQAERLRLMAPMLGRIQSEYITPMLTRVFFIKLRQGDFGNVPEMVQKSGFKIRYLSSLAMAREADEIKSIVGGLELAATFKQYKQDADDIIDYDKALKKGLVSANFPSDALHTDEDIEKRREARAEAERGMEELAVDERLAAMGRNLAEGTQAIRKGQQPA